MLTSCASRPEGRATADNVAESANHTNLRESAYGRATSPTPLQARLMNYDDARADLDDLALEMTMLNHSWNYTKRLDKLRALAILTRRALKEAAGTSDEQERRNGIEAVLDRITSMMKASAQLEHLKESYRR